MATAFAVLFLVSCIALWAGAHKQGTSTQVLAGFFLYAAGRSNGGNRMTMAYVRKSYGVPAKRGMIVETNYAGDKAAKKKGVVTSATHHVMVRFEGWNFSIPCHPTELTYFDKDNKEIWRRK